MSFQYFDLIQSVLVLVLLLLGYKLYTWKKFKALVALGLLCLILLLNTLVVLETPDNSRFTAPPQDIPEKVVVEEKTFEEKQAEKFEKLKQESKLTEENINE